MIDSGADADRRDSPSDHATVLFVCTANLCRSPYAALALGAALRERGIAGIATESAGIYAHEDSSMSTRMAVVLERHGVDGAVHRTRRLTPESVAAATVVLTAETAHRAPIARMMPGAMPRVFTLRQFARLVPTATSTQLPDDSSARRLEALVAACAAARGLRDPAGGSADDIEDPWGRSRLAYRRAARRIDAALTVVLDAVAI